MSLTATEIGDLVTGTLARLGKLRFQQIAQNLQIYEVLKRILKKDRVVFDDGVEIKRTVMYRESGAAKHVGMFQEDVRNVADVLATMSVPWRHTTTNYAFERRELLMNRGGSRIVKLLKVRRTDALLSLASVMETAFWSKPVDSTDDTTPYGVPYWIVKNASTGFNGGDPSGFAAGAGGLATATYPTWKNYTFQYTNVTKADLITKMRAAHRKVGFQSPVDVPDFRRGRGDQYRIYVNDSTIASLEDLGEAQNENLGRDLAPMDGTMAFRRNPVIWTPQLDAESDNPIYGINYGYFHPYILKGDNLHEEGPTRVSNQHNTYAVDIDLTWNVLCVDRRRQWAGYV